METFISIRIMEVPTERCKPQYVHNKIIRCCESLISHGYPQTFQLIKDNCAWAPFTDLKFCCSSNWDNSFLRRDDHSRDWMYVNYLKNKLRT